MFLNMGESLEEHHNQMFQITKSKIKGLPQKLELVHLIDKNSKQSIRMMKS
jgi:hypothetical protein